MKIAMVSRLVWASVVCSLTPVHAREPLAVAVRVAVWDRSRILKLADQALVATPLAITDKIATNSPGGPHDYFSQADYAWPNPTNRDGLPFVLRAGESNPNDSPNSPPT